MATVTAIVCGASVALASETVTKPVYDPFASEAVLNAMLTIEQLCPGKAEQVVPAPIVGLIQGTEELAVRLKLPVPALVVAMVAVGPLEPTAIDTGPTVVSASRSLGCA